MGVIKSVMVKIQMQSSQVSKRHQSSQRDRMRKAVYLRRHSSYHLLSHLMSHTRQLDTDDCRKHIERNGVCSLFVEQFVDRQCLGSARSVITNSEVRRPRISPTVGSSIRFVCRVKFNEMTPSFALSAAVRTFWRLVILETDILAPTLNLSPVSAKR